MGIKIWEEWNDGQNHVVTYNLPKSLSSSTPLAMFDMDDTLIHYKYDILYIEFYHYDPVELLYPTTVSALRQLNKKGYTIVVISNQGGIAAKKATLEQVKRKIESLDSHMDFDVSYIIAPYYDSFRKPSPGMFHFIQEKYGIQSNPTNCFYCGDNAGRANDYDDCDYQFAVNCGIPFYTPEQIFCSYIYLFYISHYIQ